tara:strand:- start:1711 stop:2598 length:888 start_codon:yes stop_codon:yes gene_type:complete
MEKSKKKIRNKKFKTLKCSPNQDKKKLGDLKGISCYSKKNILEMKAIWNKKNTNKITTNNPVEIWNFLKNNLSDKCYNELCWLNDQTFNSKIDKNKIMKKIFRPFSPESWKNKPYEWLSSIDILKVMNQYQNKYSNFIFIGPSPIDFDNKSLMGTCVWDKLCKFNLNKYIKHKSKIGIIFNLDPHYKDGSHWVALFIDIKKKFLFYFDSNGDKIPKEIKIFADRIIEQGNELNTNLKLMTNEDMEHQKKDGQCGMYTLYFIIELLKESKTPEYFKTHRITDEEMKKYRKKYFNSN